ncbi:MAG: tryptophan-rich sensory protein [Gemmatimonadetes bacterium]|nr:tryptophan-rich sensory protein [Gemmatimonadota bacterium]
MTRPRAVFGLVVSLAICYGAAAVGAQFMPGEWYEELAKPTWTPSSWLFAPVWTALYGMMAVAAWLVWRRHGAKGARWPLLLFAVQLSLNSMWSWLFFGLESPGVAMVDIVALWIAILGTTFAFWRLSRRAATLMVPYVIWVSFAAALNFAIWRLNT